MEEVGLAVIIYDLHRVVSGMGGEEGGRKKRERTSGLQHEAPMGFMEGRAEGEENNRMHCGSDRPLLIVHSIRSPRETIDNPYSFITPPRCPPRSPTAGSSTPDTTPPLRPG